jgi:hypothetical protein
LLEYRGIKKAVVLGGKELLRVRDVGVAAVSISTEFLINRRARLRAGLNAAFIGILTSSFR